jgi:DegV family protein with EDD domain
VLEAAQMAEAGSDMLGILARLESLRSRMHIFLSLDNLRFARMSGRVGMAQALLASLLNVKPMITVTEGKLTLAGRARSRGQALRGLVDNLVHALEPLTGAPPKIAVIHAQAPEAAAELATACADRLRTQPAVVSTLSLGIAVHFGPGTVGVIGYNP